MPSPAFIEQVAQELKESDGGIDEDEIFKKPLEALQSGMLEEAEKHLSEATHMVHGKQGEQKQVDLNAKDSLFEAQLKEALQEGDFKVTKALGQRFQRSFRPGSEQHAQFKAMKSLEDKTRFRMAWVQSQFDELQKKKVWERSYETIDSQKGEYVPFAVLVAREGGDRSAEVAALRYATKCAKMQGRWVSFNPMTERWEYLHVKRQFVELHREAWRQYTEERMSRPTSTLTAADTSMAAMAAGGTAATQQATQKGTARGEHRASQAADDHSKEATDSAKSPHSSAKEKPTKKKTDLERALMGASKTKNEFHSVLAKSSECLRVIASGDVAWSWAKNDANQGRLQKTLDELQEAVGNGEHRVVILTDMRELKQRLGADALLGLLLKFNEVMPGKVAALGKELRRLMAMHAVQAREEGA